jgi:hypothetical protein
MYRIPGAFSTATTSSAPAVRKVQPTRGPPPGIPQAPGGSAAGPAEIISALAEDYERITQSLNDVVASPLAAAGLDLQAALALIGDHPASSKICHAVAELDQAVQAIGDILGTILDHP